MATNKMTCLTLVWFFLAIVLASAVHGYFLSVPKAALLGSTFRIRQQRQQQHRSLLHASGGGPTFYNDFEGYNPNGNNEHDNDTIDDDDDDFLLTLAAQREMEDWRTFRRNLGARMYNDDSGNGSNSSSSSSLQQQQQQQPPVGIPAANVEQQGCIKNKPTLCRENQDLLRRQNKALCDEFESAWAHITATPEVGGLIVRMPLEVELQRNVNHSLTGQRLKQEYSEDSEQDSSLELWYKRAQSMIEAGLTNLPNGADGNIDISDLDENILELLDLFLDHQDTRHDVCLVLEQERGNATALVLNRPMAMKLTEHLGQLVLFGVFSSSDAGSTKSRRRTPSKKRSDLNRFIGAFGSECAVYIGGPDDQDKPAELIHGIAELAGAVEIAPGTGIYRGGLAAAVDGVLAGQYNPLEFRFFVGRHDFEASTLDLAVHLGKYQPVACARALVLKQSISLPKPLWHEVLELCGGEMTEISHVELKKRDNIQIQIVDDEDYDDDIVDDIVDDLGKLSRSDDDDDDDDDEDDYYYRRR